MKRGRLALFLAAALGGALPACSSGSQATPSQPASVEATPDQACALAALCWNGGPRCTESKGLVTVYTPACAALCPGSLGCLVDPGYAATYEANDPDAGEVGADGGPPCPAYSGTVTVQCEYGG
jgi:hypothetical protein